MVLFYYLTSYLYVSFQCKERAQYCLHTVMCLKHLDFGFYSKQITMEINLHVFDKGSFTYSSILTLLGLYSTRNHICIGYPTLAIDMPKVNPTLTYLTRTIFHRLALGFVLGPLGSRWVHWGIGSVGFTLGPRGFLDTNFLV